MKKTMVIGMALLLLAGCGGVDTYYVHQPWGGWHRMECTRTGDMTRLADLQRHCDVQPVNEQEAESYR